MNLLNPEFADPGFIPDPEKRYFYSKYGFCSGFNRLQSLVIGGPEKISEIREFLLQNPDEFRRQALHVNECGLTALMIASLNSRRDSSDEIVEILIPYSDVNAREKDGWSALTWSCRFSGTESTDETVRLLIPYSDVKISDNHGMTSLMWASAGSGNDSTEETVRILIPHSDVNAVDEDGETALIKASRYSRTSSTEETVRILIPHSDVNAQDVGGRTALMYALIGTYSSEETVLMLIPHSDVNARDNYGDTSLSLAMELECSNDLIECFLRRSPSLVSELKNRDLSRFSKWMLEKSRSTFVFRNEIVSK